MFCELKARLNHGKTWINNEKNIYFLGLGLAISDQENKGKKINISFRVANSESKNTSARQRRSPRWRAEMTHQRCGAYVACQRPIFENIFEGG